MRRRIPLRVPIAFLPGHHLFKLRADIFDDTRVGMFVNQDAGGGVGHEYIAYTAFYSAGFNYAFNPAGNFLELYLRVCLYVKFVYQIPPHIEDTFYILHPAFPSGNIHENTLISLLKHVTL